MNPRPRTSARIIETYARSKVDVVLVRRIYTDDLFGKSNKNLLVIDPVTGSNGSFAGSERIPRETYSRGKVSASAS